MPGRILPDPQVTATIDSLYAMRDHIEMTMEGELPAPNVRGAIDNFTALVTPAVNQLYLADSLFGNFDDEQLEVLSVALETDIDHWTVGADGRDVNAQLYEAVQLEIAKRPELMRKYEEA